MSRLNWAGLSCDSEIMCLRWDRFNPWWWWVASIYRQQGFFFTGEIILKNFPVERGADIDTKPFGDLLWSLDCKNLRGDLWNLESCQLEAGKSCELPVRSVLSHNKPLNPWFLSVFNPRFDKETSYSRFFIITSLRVSMGEPFTDHTVIPIWRRWERAWLDRPLRFSKYSPQSSQRISLLGSGFDTIATKKPEVQTCINKCNPICYSMVMFSIFPQYI